MAKLKCSFCSIRKGDRHCPALNAPLCSRDCGEQHGTGISCPADCPFWKRFTEQSRKDAFVTYAGYVRALTDMEREAHHTNYIILMVWQAAYHHIFSEYAEAELYLANAFEWAVREMHAAQTGLIIPGVPTNLHFPELLKAFVKGLARVAESQDVVYGVRQQIAALKLEMKVFRQVHADHPGVYLNICAERHAKLEFLFAEEPAAPSDGLVETLDRFSDEESSEPLIRTESGLLLPR